MVHDFPGQYSNIVLRSRMQLAVIKTIRGQYKNAIADFVILNEECQSTIDSKDSPISAEISYNYAVVLTRVGNFNDAITKLRGIDASSQIGEASYLQVNCSRLLGLANAYLGHFSQASRYIDRAKAKMEKVKEDCNQSRPASPETVPCATSIREGGTKAPRMSHLEAAVRLSQAQILLMQGKAQDGMSIVGPLLVDTEKSFGTSHLLTLETRFILCRLLTETGQLGQAKVKCVETIDLMAEYLDQDHPLILKATSALVGLHRLDSCPSEAFTVSENLAYKARELLGTDNRQTLRYEFQVAALNLWMGNHVDGLKQLEDAALTSSDRWGDDSPWTLSCVIEKSIALSLSGRSGECKKNLEDVLRIQCRLFELAIDDYDGDDLISRLLECLAPKPNQSKDFVEVHPSLLYALGAWAKNELTRSDAQRDRVIQAQRAILQHRKRSPSFGPSHYATLQAGLDLANTLRVDPDLKNSHEAESHYSEVISSGIALQGDLIVLLAEQGKYLSKIMHPGKDLEEDKDLEEEKTSEEETERFLDIPKLISHRLGSRHPDTLQAMLTALAPTFCLDEGRAVEMSVKLHQRLHDPRVRPQRPVECIKIEEKLGLIHYRLKNRAEAAKIFAALAESLRNGEGALLSSFDEGQEIKIRLDQETSRIVGEVLNQQWQEAEQSRKNHRFSDAVESLRLFSDLFKSVHGEYEEVSEKVSVTLAVALWEAGQHITSEFVPGFTKQTASRQQKEAVDILKSVISRMGHEDGVRDQLKEELDGWKEALATSSTHEPPSPSHSSIVESVRHRISVDECRDINKENEYEPNSVW
ncbi:hypothetical protein PG997_001647 [Apiospora hydei]|uniref:Uncharacterized protein n=1 Tax=Apiospora hydei TaxID=1337664 RepID=A0ABR1XE47_9PEZI